jgi:hypothetical protein
MIKSWIWDYAAGMGKSVNGVGPKDMIISMCGDQLHVSATMHTAQEAECVREIINILGKRLPMTRPMLHADIYGNPPPKPSFEDEIIRMFGDPAKATETGTAMTAGHGAKHDGAAPTGFAQKDAP